MRKSNALRVLLFGAFLVAPLFIAQPALAADGAAQAQNFMKNIINVMAGFGGTLATGFLVWSGIMYITSSGNPDKMDKSKRIMQYAAIGLVIVIAAAAIANFVSTEATNAFGK